MFSKSIRKAYKMDTTNFKSYQVAVPRVNASDKFYIYGIHDTVESALLDQLNRAYKYNQKTVVYAIDRDNNVIRLGVMQA